MVRLKKQRVAEPRVWKSVEPAFAKEVKSLLGYNPTRVGQVVTRRQTLSSVLYELGVTVFNPDSVERYKNAKQREQQSKEHTGRWWRWRVVSLRDYTRPVPTAVLKTAVRVARGCPKASFRVEELKLDNMPRTADPFLIVSLGGQRYYIAQWDEPTFSDEQ